MPPQRNLWVIGGANKRQGQQMPRLADFRGRPKFGVEMPEDSEPARNSLQTAPGAGIPSSSALALPDSTHSLCRRPRNYFGVLVAVFLTAFDGRVYSKTLFSESEILRGVW